MTATVTLLASHRRNHKRAETCKHCRTGYTCAPHRLLDLHARLTAARGTDLQDEAIADALAVIENVIGHLFADERPAR